MREIDFNPFRNEQQLADAAFEEMLEALQNQDTEALIDMFATEVVEDSEDFHENLEKLFDFFENLEVLSLEGESMGSGRARNFGRLDSELIRANYTIQTTHATYYSWFAICTVYIANPNAVGIRRFGIFTEQAWEERGHWRDGIVIEVE